MKYICELEIILSPEMIRRRPLRLDSQSTFTSKVEVSAENAQTALNKSVRERNDNAGKKYGGLWVYSGRAYQLPKKESAEPLAVYKSSAAETDDAKELQRALRRGEERYTQNE